MSEQYYIQINGTFRLADGAFASGRFNSGGFHENSFSANNTPVPDELWKLKYTYAEDIHWTYPDGCELPGTRAWGGYTTGLYVKGSKVTGDGRIYKVKDVETLQYNKYVGESIIVESDLSHNITTPAGEFYFNILDTGNMTPVPGLNIEQAYYINWPTAGAYLNENTLSSFYSDGLGFYYGVAKSDNGGGAGGSVTDVTIPFKDISKTTFQETWGTYDSTATPAYVQLSTSIVHSDLVYDYYTSLGSPGSVSFGNQPAPSASTPILYRVPKSNDTLSATARYVTPESTDGTFYGDDPYLDYVVVSFTDYTGQPRSSLWGTFNTNANAYTMQREFPSAVDSDSYYNYYTSLNLPTGFNFTGYVQDNTPVIYRVPIEPVDPEYINSIVPAYTTNFSSGLWLNS